MKSTTVRFADPIYGQLEQASRLTGLPINSIVTVACLDWLRQYVFPNFSIASARPAAPHGGWALKEAAMRASMVDLVASPLKASDPIASFTAAAQDALAHAHAHAEEADEPWIGTSHLLLGLYEVDVGRAGQALRRLAVDVAGIVAQQKPEELPPQREGSLLPTSRVRRVLKLAQEEARRQRAPLMGTDHLLLGLLSDGESWTAAALEEAGATMEACRQALGEIGPES
jgi:ClpA/ClpB-like protein